MKTVKDVDLEIILLIELKYQKKLMIIFIIRTGVIIETFNCEFMNILKSFTCGYFMNTAKKTTDVTFIN